MLYLGGLRQVQREEKGVEGGGQEKGGGEGREDGRMKVPSLTSQHPPSPSSLSLSFSLLLSLPFPLPSQHYFYLHP